MKVAIKIEINKIIKQLQYKKIGTNKIKINYHLK